MSKDDAFDWAKTPERLPAELRMSRAEADLHFRDALVDSQVPLGRS
jgi:hypothetical protein